MKEEESNEEATVKVKVATIINAFNQKILAKLVTRYNYRQRYNNKIKQLNIEYEFERLMGDVRCKVYLRTGDKLLGKRLPIVIRAGYDNTEELRDSLTDLMVEIMKSGLRTVIRTAQRLPEEMM